MTARKVLELGAGLLTLLAATTLIAFKRDWVPMWPSVLATEVALLALLLLGIVVLTAVDWRRRRLGPRAALARLLIASGLLLVTGAGLANWLFSVQGYLILTEGDVVPLSHGRHLEDLDRGPWSDPDELDVALELARVDLVPAEAGAFFPEAKLLVRRNQGPAEELQVEGNGWAASGPLRFHGGAFGFAPRIVVEKKEGGVVFDRTVPFRCRRDGPNGIRFEDELTIAKEELRLRGAVVLDQLDPEMKGHPRLAIELWHDGTLLGNGLLLPGHAADLGGEWRVGFAGLGKWIELDVSRRSYPDAIRLGLVLAALGLLVGLAGAIVAIARRAPAAAPLESEPEP